MTRRQRREARRLRAYTIGLGLGLMVMSAALIALLIYLVPGEFTSTVIGCYISAGVMFAGSAYAVVMAAREEL